MDNLVQKINSYLNSNLNLPLFVCISRQKYYKILNLHLNKIKTSEFCLDEDKEPDLTSLKERVKNECIPSLLLGLGDYIEIKSGVINIINTYISLNIKSKIIVVLPLSLKSYLINISSKDIRIKNRLIIIDDNDIETDNKYDIVKGFKEYLKKLEIGECPEGVITDLENINNGMSSKSIFEQILKKYPIFKNKLNENNGTNEEWTRLLEDFTNSTASNDILIKFENDRTANYLIIEDIRKNDYDSWKLFISLKLHTFKSNSYLKYVLNKTISKDKLFENIIESILDFDIKEDKFKEYYKERKSILKSSEDIDVATYKNKIVTKGENRIFYLTDNTDIEKKAIIEYIVDTKKINNIENIYPDLHKYIQSYQFDNQQFTEYFNQYKMQKLRNKIDNDFINKVIELSILRPYNTLPTRISEFNKIDQTNSYLIFLDALGGEYLSYITKVCNELQVNVNVKIARANLPSSTENNKDFFEEWKKEKKHIYDLDHIKHHPEKSYDYNREKKPIHIVDELNVINKALKYANQKLLEGIEKVVIASDHGSSRLAVICEDNIIETICNSKSSGRYCEGVNLPNGNNIVIDENLAIIADYSKFSGGRKAEVEVHGGATLEEVIVPIIELSLKDKKKIIEVELLNEIIYISYKEKAKLQLIVTPNFDNINIKINNATYIAEKISNNNYIVDIGNIKIIGEYSLEIYENQNLIANKKIIIKNQGFAEKDLF